MSPLVDNVLVAAVVAASLGYALFALGPRSLKRRVLSRLAGWASLAPPRLGLRRFAGRIGAAAAKSAGACGGCDSCGSGADASASAQSPGSGDIKIPLASIGRRGK